MNVERQLIMFVRVWPIVVTMLSFMVFRKNLADIIPFLTCAETATTNLIKMKECKYRSDKHFSCNVQHRTENGLDTSTVFFLVNDIRPEIDLRQQENATICFGIIEWNRERKVHEMGKYKIVQWIDIRFEPSLTVGVLQVNRTCWIIQRLNCIFEVNIRADVLSLPPLIFSLDEANFWNFSSLLFRPQLEWLVSMKLEGAVHKHFPATFPGLRGASLKSLRVSGSFGRDDNGPLPLLDNLPLLDWLEMRNSALKELTPGSLRGTPNIQIFNALQNQFGKIPTDIKSLKNLEVLTFQSKVEKFNLIPETFAGLHKLYKIDLSGTHIEQWPHNFTFLPALRLLRLIGCRMKSFSTLQTDFRFLLILDIKKNLISSLAEDAFSGMEYVSTIDLSENLLTALSEHTFTDLRYLFQLNLKSNKLIIWPSLFSLYFQYLDLSNNSLENILNFGSQNVTVDTLEISLNRISKWDDPHIFLREKLHASQANPGFAISDLRDLSLTSTQNQANRELTPWVSFVNLSGNKIEIFSEEMIYSLNFLDNVDLRDNIINCGDCRTSYLTTWLNNMTRMKTQLFGTSDKLTCYQPEHLRGEYVQAMKFDDMCLTPRRHLWWGLGTPLLISGSVFIFVIAASFFCRAEIVYLLHLAKGRTNSFKPEEDRNDCAFDVFICYSSRNRKWVTQRLNRLLEHPPECYRTCLFDRDFRMGTHIVSNAVDAINDSRKAIIVLSQYFVDSKWCQWELEMANHKLFTEDGDYLVLLQLEPLERARLPRLLRFLLDTRPVVRWPRPETAPAVLAAAAQLRRALGPSLRQRRAAPAAAAAPLHYSPEAADEADDDAGGYSPELCDDGTAQFQMSSMQTGSSRAADIFALHFG